jgi:hypothetical protein
MSLYPQNVLEVLGEYDHDLAITTLPAHAICKNPHDHQFEGVPFWLKQIEVEPDDKGRDIFLYNGILSDPWYRWSNIGFQGLLESTAPLEGAQPGTKAVKTNCACFSKVLKRAGRWAQWKHGVLLTDAYKDTHHYLDMERL